MLAWHVWCRANHLTTYRWQMGKETQQDHDTMFLSIVVERFPESDQSVIAFILDSLRIPS